MSTSSTNLGLTLPDGNEYVSRTIINGNYQIIDSDVGGVEDGLAIVVNGNTAPKAINSGAYLFIKNHSSLPTGGYHATAAIANGGAVSSSNVAADSDGIANALNAKLTLSFTTVTDLNGIKNALLTLAQSMDRLQTAKVGFYINGNIDGFVRGYDYGGSINIVGKNATNLMFSCDLVSENAQEIIIGYSNGTWTFEPIIANLSTKASIFATGSVSANSSDIITVGRGRMYVLVCGGAYATGSMYIIFGWTAGSGRVQTVKANSAVTVSMDSERKVTIATTENISYSFVDIGAFA